MIREMRKGWKSRGKEQAHRQAEEARFLAGAGTAAWAAAGAGMMARSIRACRRPVCPVLLEPACTH